METQVEEIFDAARKKALARGGGGEANMSAIAQAAERAITLLAVELDRVRRTLIVSGPGKLNK